MIRAAFVVLLLLQAAPAKDPAAKAVQTLAEKEKFRPGGILRIQRFPQPLAKGWSVLCGPGEDAGRRRLDVAEPSHLFFVDRKAGPRYAHAVELWLVTASKGELSRLEAEWWPEVRDEKGAKVAKSGDREVDGEKVRWWVDGDFRFLGDAGPSIQDAQDAVKFAFMMSKLPEGSTGLTLYSCPATLEAGGSVAVAKDGKLVEVAKAGAESFVIYVDQFPGQPQPHGGRVLLYDRKAAKSTEAELDGEPVLLDAKGAKVALDDGGRALGAWHAEDAHSFLSRAQFGRR